MVPIGDAQMGDKNQTQFEDDDLGSIDDIDDDGDFDESSVAVENPPANQESEEERRRRARREIERRNELKALRSELDEWDDLADEDDL